MAPGCNPARGPQFFLRGAVIAVAVAGSVALLRAQSETIITVQNGTHNLSTILTTGGTSTNRIRYRPATAGGVTIRGGGTINRSYVTLEGFKFDSTLNPNYPADGVHTVTVAQNMVGVRIEQSQLKGSSNDVHTGYTWDTNTRDCKESTGHPGGAGLNIQSGANVTVADSLVHGSYNGTNHMNGVFLRLERTLMRGNFNGLQIGTDSTVEFIDSVLWDSPNHPIVLDSTTQATLVMDNSVVVMGQNTVRTVGEAGGSHVIVRHSTYYSPHNHPCGSDPGIDPTNVRQQILIRNNLFAVVFNNWWRGLSSQMSFYTSDYNMGIHWDDRTNQVRLDGNEIPLAQWKAATGKDARSFVARPVFVDAPVFASPMPTTGNASNQWGFRVPTSVAQVRGWFALAAGSPGKGAASDGFDIGIDNRVTSGGAVFAPRPPANVHIVR